MGRQVSRSFTVTLSNGETLRIVAKDATKAIKRADRYCKLKDSELRVTNVVEVI